MSPAPVNASTVPNTQASMSNESDKAEKIKALEAEVEKLKAIVDHFSNEKAKAKKAIKDWTAQFTQENGKEPNAQDKEDQKDLFVDHKKVRLHKRLLVSFTASTH